MNADTVGRLAVTWHPDADAEPTERARLDRLAGALADGGLPDGLGPPTDRDVQVCVRRVRLPRHRMPWDAADDQLVAGWARVVERAVADAVSGGGPEVVRYRSRTQARHDLVTSVLRHDRARAWAWQLLDLWPRDVNPADPAAVLGAALVELGREEPAAVVGLLVAVTSAGELAHLCATAGDELLVALVHTAWQAAGGRAEDLPDVVRPAAASAATPAEGSGTARGPDGVGGELPSTVLRRSVIARALCAAALPLSARARGALWAAAVLEAEPALAAAPVGAALVADLIAPPPSRR
ncbi:hypothetical protein, partial [Modestobacter altitudinis]|uniref:hypothetical protein n=1 Tax=Modestobacter altitudinis TaxID=2213158 RepID=UPI001C554309